jgi:hypothetical protein
MLLYACCLPEEYDAANMVILYIKPYFAGVPARALIFSGYGAVHPYHKKLSNFFIERQCFNQFFRVHAPEH